MSRPEFLNCVMTPGVISAIRREQDFYDQDPDGYEELERQREELHCQEQEAFADEQRRQMQEEAEEYFRNNLPF